MATGCNKNLLTICRSIYKHSACGIKVSKEILTINSPLLCSNFCTAIRVNKEWNPKYIYYYLRLVHRSNIFFNYEGKTSGIHNLDITSAFSSIELPNINLEEQNKIVSKIDVIDRKISLNRKMNATFEAMAKQLYDYWFVQFDFPNAEGKPYKSSGGKMVWNEKLKREIPEGWEVKNLIEVVDIYNGATPSTADEDNYGGDIVWITPKDLSDQKNKITYYGARNITDKGYNSASTHLLPKGTLLMSSRAPIGLLSVAGCELCTNQGFKNMVPKDSDDIYALYYYIQRHIKQIEQLGTGTTFKEVSKDDLEKFPIFLVQNGNIKTKWVESMKPIFEKQFSLIKENDKLTSLRDYLLPLLMNGQIIIKN